MRFSAANPKTKILQRRERWRRDHASAPTVASAFPQVARILIDLSFAHDSLCTLAPQSHVLHAAARAFFEFPCPYADCDGYFDLNAAIAAALDDQRNQAQGGLECTGERSKGQVAKVPCQLHLDYRMLMEYRSDSAR